MNIKSLSKNIYKGHGGGFTDRLQFAVNEISDGDKVLEVGVGWGELACNIKRFKNVALWGVDIAESALEKVKSYLEDSQLVDLSTEKLKFQDDQFDAVICLEIFEHLQNPYHALMEIQRVLKPRGKLILSVPNYRGGHIMIYPGLITFKFFKLFLQQNYFKICKCKGWGPVWNRDNLGVWLSQRSKNKFLKETMLFPVQVFLRFIQTIANFLGLKVIPLYWCYFFVCGNYKDKQEKPFAIRQLEQTSELKENLGWYHHYYHSRI